MLTCRNRAKLSHGLHVATMHLADAMTSGWLMCLGCFSIGASLRLVVVVVVVVVATVCGAQGWGFGVPLLQPQYARGTC